MISYSSIYKKLRNSRKIWFSIFFCVLSLYSNPGVNAQTKMDYANSLMKDRDYFRAISEFKEILYYSQNIVEQNICLYNIASAYNKSNKYKASIRFSAKLLNRPEIDDLHYSKANILMGLNYYGLRVLPNAEDYFNRALIRDNTGKSSYYLALLEAEKLNWSSASTKYNEISQKYPDIEVGNISKELAVDVLKGNQLQYKNTFAASLFSTIIPGSGQIYCKHYYDGIQAFMYVSAFAFASYASYKYDKKFNNNYLTTYVSLSITTMFHLGNIIGAQRTAKYHNMRQEQNFLNQIREKVFSVDY